MKKRCLAIVSMIIFSVCAFAGCNTSNLVNNNKVEVGIINHNVSFQTNGGTSVGTLTIETLTAAPKTVKKNYLFQGWYLDENLTEPVVYPLKVKWNMTLYAKWLKIYDKIGCKDAEIKMFFDGNSNITYRITPPSFDMQALAKLNYTMQIHVTYKVHYVKEYDILWDIGYAGAPKYEVYILNESNQGVKDEDLTTRTSPIERTITYHASASELIDEHIFLQFSTNNIQNRICFTDISVTYSCDN